MAKRFLLENINEATVGVGIFGDGSGVSLVVFGTFGGTEVFIEISENNTDWVPITENGGNILSFTSASSRILTKIPATQLIRARAVAGTPSNLNVIITS